MSHGFCSDSVWLNVIWFLAQVHFFLIKNWVYLVKDILVLKVKGMWKDNFEIAFWNWPDAMCIYFKHHFVMLAILKDTTLIKFSSTTVDPTS